MGTSKSRAAKPPWLTARSFSSNTSRTTVHSKSPALSQRENSFPPTIFSSIRPLSGLPNFATSFLVLGSNYLPVRLLFTSRKPGLTLPQHQAQGCDRRRTSGILCVLDPWGRSYDAVWSRPISRHTRRGISGWPNARPNSPLHESLIQAARQHANILSIDSSVLLAPFAALSGLPSGRA